MLPRCFSNWWTKSVCSGSKPNACQAAGRTTIATMTCWALRHILDCFISRGVCLWPELGVPHIAESFAERCSQRLLGRINRGLEGFN